MSRMTSSIGSARSSPRARISDICCSMRCERALDRGEVGRGVAAAGVCAVALRQRRRRRRAASPMPGAGPRPPSAGSGCATARSSMISVCHRRRSVRSTASGSGLVGEIARQPRAASRGPRRRPARTPRGCACAAARIAASSQRPAQRRTPARRRSTSNSGGNVRATCSAKAGPARDGKRISVVRMATTVPISHLDHAVARPRRCGGPSRGSPSMTIAAVTQAMRSDGRRAEK